MYRIVTVRATTYCARLIDRLHKLPAESPAENGTQTVLIPLPATTSW